MFDHALFRRNPENMDRKPIPVLIYDKSQNKFKLDEQVLKNLLAGSQSTSFVSAIGAPRSGKSFLLNYAARFLSNNGKMYGLDQDSEPLGFFYDPDGNPSAEDVHDEIPCVLTFEKGLSLDNESGGKSLAFLDIAMNHNGRDEDWRVYAALEFFALMMSTVSIYVNLDPKIVRSYFFSCCLRLYNQ